MCIGYMQTAWHFKKGSSSSTDLGCAQGSQNKSSLDAKGQLYYTAYMTYPCLTSMVYQVLCRVSIVHASALQSHGQRHRNCDSQVQYLGQILFQQFLTSLFPGLHILHVAQWPCWENGACRQLEWLSQQDQALWLSLIIQKEAQAEFKDREH